MKGISTLNGIIIVLLIAAIAGGAVTLAQKQPWSGQPLEITLAEPAPTATPDNTCERESPQKISINRADAWLLEALPGIGPALAQGIIDYREANGPFAMTGELKLVPGIGDATFDDIEDLITVD
jgi:competence protein ComEA